MCVCFFFFFFSCRPSAAVDSLHVHSIFELDQMCCVGCLIAPPGKGASVLQHEGPGEKQSINGGRRRERKRVGLMLKTSASKSGEQKTTKGGNNIMCCPLGCLPSLRLARSTLIDE